MAEPAMNLNLTSAQHLIAALGIAATLFSLQAFSDFSYANKFPGGRSIEQPRTHLA